MDVSCPDGKMHCWPTLHAGLVPRLASNCKRANLHSPTRLVRWTWSCMCSAVTTYVPPGRPSRPPDVTSACWRDLQGGGCAILTKQTPPEFGPLIATGAPRFLLPVPLLQPDVHLGRCQSSHSSGICLFPAASRLCRHIGLGPSALLATPAAGLRDLRFLRRIVRSWQGGDAMTQHPQPAFHGSRHVISQIAIRTAEPPQNHRNVTANNHELQPSCSLFLTTASVLISRTASSPLHACNR